MKYAGAALNQTPIHWENNIKNIKDIISQAQEANVDLLCLPELCITGYGCEDLFLSEWVAEKALQLVLDLLPLTQNIAVTFGLPVHFKGKTYNSICFVENGKILGFSAKQFLANDGIHYETRWFQAWPGGIKDTIESTGKTYPIGDIIYEVKGKSIAFEICEDAWRENRPGIRYATQNVDIILNPSASHFAFQKTQERRTLIITSSKKFNCTYIYANLLGNEAGKIIYDGEILIADKGKLLAENDLLSFKNTNLLECKENDKPISPKNYSKNDEFQKAVSLALFDYLRKAYIKSFSIKVYSKKQSNQECS